MTKDEAIAALEAELKELKDWGCIHQDEFGTHYAPDFEDDITTMEQVIDTVRGLHTTEFVADCHFTGLDTEILTIAATYWRKEMGEPS